MIFSRNAELREPDAPPTDVCPFGIEKWVVFLSETLYFWDQTGDFEEFVVLFTPIGDKSRELTTCEIDAGACMFVFSPEDRRE